MKPQQLELGVAKHPLREKFDRYNEQNPEIWEMFKRFAFEAIRNGHKALSVCLVVERIRWETTISTSDPDFKISNTFKPFYARKFHQEYPMYGGIFRTKPSVADL